MVQSENNSLVICMQTFHPTLQSVINDRRGADIVITSSVAHLFQARVSVVAKSALPAADDYSESAIA
jgi:hypothetical protein